MDSDLKHHFVPRLVLRLLLLLWYGLIGQLTAGLFAADQVRVLELGPRLTVDTGTLILQLELTDEGAVLLQSLKRVASDHD